jgi:hypothetical protein
MTKEQRRYPRVECTGEAGVQIAPRSSCCAAKIVDLSAGGCLLVLKHPQCLTQDTIVDLTFTINNLPFRTLGQVKAKRSDKAIGFQFRSLSDSLRRQLEELLQQLIENRPARSLLRGLREKRRYPRIKCTGPAAVQIAAGEESCPATIVNLSARGCLLHLRRPQRLWRDMLVELTFEINHLPFRVRGQVKAIRTDTTIGFQFPLLSERVRNQLEDLMKELMATIMKQQAARTRT